MSTKHPLPRHFTDFDSYERAVVAFKLAQVPGITRYDSHDEAVRKAKAIAAAEHDAKDMAYDNWNAWVEHCEELHERGLGAGWA